MTTIDNLIKQGLTKKQLEALIFLEQLRGERTRAAYLIRRSRKDLIELFDDSKLRKKRWNRAIWRDLMTVQKVKVYGIDGPIKPSKAAFEASIDVMDERLNQSREPIVGDDGYSYCGLEDTRSEYLEQLEEKRDLFVACLEFLD